MSNNGKKNVVGYLMVRLFIVGVVAAAILGKVDAITAGPIAEQSRLKEENGMMEVLPDGSDFEIIADSTDDSLAGNSTIEGTTVKKVAKSGAGYVLTVLPGGFGGDIKMMVGIDNDGVIQGVRILEHAESAGLGAKSTEPEFYTQYDGLSSGGLAVQKDGGDIVAITGATITSRAVTSGVNDAYSWFETNGGAF
ncbi:MAG: RnfABCDGE type electron transport complex subunit G [Firmicutes bacterium]|nr:RnfABCDGE type electron transport complex subunit G [Bacillota bacterium]MBR0105392.1 RnfABCDGE type electron transport complex subunit G [Bacillota bacterium]MBR2593690.1 RnfABCDGE type electron transport complex subunit G [Bacillota bacterium]